VNKGHPDIKIFHECSNLTTIQGLVGSICKSGVRLMPISVASRLPMRPVVSSCRQMQHYC